MTDARNATIKKQILERAGGRCECGDTRHPLHPSGRCNEKLGEWNVFGIHIRPNPHLKPPNDLMGVCSFCKKLIG